jgi:hypothetical protein
MEKWGYRSTIFYLVIKWRWVASFTPRPLSVRGNSPRHSFYMRFCGPQNRSSWEKSLVFDGNRTPTVQPCKWINIMMCACSTNLVVLCSHLFDFYRGYIGVTECRAHTWVLVTLVLTSHIHRDSGGVTATYGAHFWRRFERKVSFKPGSYTQYLQSYFRIWKRTTVNCAYVSTWRVYSRLVG